MKNKKLMIPLFAFLASLTACESNDLPIQHADSYRGIICRNHSAEIDYGLAKYEFEIPFWIYCTHRYAVRHPQIFKQIVEARKRPYMTDALPHLLLYLAGISTPDYCSRYNILSDDYDASRPRLLKGKTDYDKLVPPAKPANTVSTPFK